MSEEALTTEVSHVMPSMAGRSVKGRRNPTHLLRDYRFVYRHLDGEDGTSAQKMIRELYKKDAWKFMATLKVLEREHKEAIIAGRERAAARERARAKQGSGLADDDGGLEVVQEWLRERSHGRQGAVEVADEGGAVSADQAGRS